LEGADFGQRLDKKKKTVFVLHAWIDFTRSHWRDNGILSVTIVTPEMLNANVNLTTINGQIIQKGITLSGRSGNGR
jgi:hypothetical protein